MPWSGSSFQRHNLGLSPARSAHAAKIANHVLQSTGNEGEAIATGNKWALRHPHRDSGGTLGDNGGGIGGAAPDTLGMMNPMTSGMYQQYASMPVEKLQEMNARLGGTPYGQIIRQVLQRKLTQPSSQPENQVQMPTAQSLGMESQQQARGGMTRLAGGGSPLGVPMSMADPWWTKQEAYGADKGGGFLAGTSGGRQDKIETTAPGGAYVLPADIISGLGEGNSLAGARIMQEALGTGPHGTPLPRGARGRGPPRPPREAPASYGNAGYGSQYAKGGSTGETPVALSHGEFVLTAQQAIALAEKVSDGVKLTYNQAKRVLDKWVVHERRRHVDQLKKLEPPVGAKS